MLSFFLIVLVAASNAIPLSRSEMDAGVAEPSYDVLTKASNEQAQEVQDQEIWDAVTFARLDKQLRSEEFVVSFLICFCINSFPNHYFLFQPLGRRIREALNYAARLDESALDSQSKIRLSNASPSDERDSEPRAMLFVEPASTLDSERADVAKIRAKKSERSFTYLPSRG